MSSEELKKIKTAIEHIQEAYVHLDQVLQESPAVIRVRLNLRESEFWLNDVSKVLESLGYGE
ncbi:hypothetical protein [uncultured Roseobacter sp.]|uniref:hypothetical protein n=1 Tax=uncultured Roseobacter sp. TaxID=114847 RepID=UPI0026383F51|nr:hypothetical protein [uncultured Roseobacter sp.]